MTLSNSNMEMLRKKASQSSCTYRVGAIAFDKNGCILGCSSNKHSQWNVLDKTDGEGRSGTAKHAERELFNRYGWLVKTIVICRIGGTGNILPISPCKTCSKIAKKYGARIISVSGPV